MGEPVSELIENVHVRFNLIQFCCVGCAILVLYPYKDSILIPVIGLQGFAPGHTAAMGSETVIMSENMIGSSSSRTSHTTLPDRER